MGNIMDRRAVPMTIGSIEQPVTNVLELRCTLGGVQKITLLYCHALLHNTTYDNIWEVPKVGVLLYAPKYYIVLIIGAPK